MFLSRIQYLLKRGNTMPIKQMIKIALIPVLLIGIGLDSSFAQQSTTGQNYKVNPELCALMLRKGQESFSRARYIEAKELFRKAIVADPGSQKAWSYYDLAQMYSVAEQFKNHGRIVQSTAPIPEQITEMVQPQTSVVAPPPLPSKEKGKLP